MASYRAYLGRLLVLACVLAGPGWAGEEAPSPAELLQHLASDNADQRDQAARLIWDVAPGDNDILKGVTGLLGHKNPEVRLAAARLLGGLVVGDGQCVRGRESRRKASSRLHGSASEKAVRAALDWLARFQDHSADGTNGRWDPSGFAKHAEGQTLDGAGDSRYEVGVTGLALLAFLGGGYTDRGDERYRDTVRDGLAFLVASQAENGCCGPQDLARRSTNHAVATLALCEAWILTGDPKYRRPAQKAVTFLEQSHLPDKAWGYVHDAHSAPDTHTTGWVLSALGIARRGGLSVNESGLRAGLGWFASMEEDGFFIVGYETKGGPVCYGGWGPARRPPTSRGAYPMPPVSDPLAGTRAGLLLDPDDHALPYGAHSLALWCRLLLDPSSRSRVPDASGYSPLSPFELAYEKPSWASDRDVDACMWAYAAAALAQLARPEVAGKRTVSWFKALHDAVLPKQRKDGVAAGSWDPVDAWAIAGGRIYSTAMIVRALEAPYLYEPFGESTVAVRSAVSALRRVGADTQEGGAVGEAARESLALIERAR